MINIIMIDMTQIKIYGRILGIILIIIGFAILLAGALGGIGFKVYQMATHGQIPLAVLITGVSFIVTGYIIRFIFRKRS